jgi:hypothetical protein
MSAPTFFYDQWRKSRAPSNFASRGDFQKRLLAGEVEAFDMTQDCNMGGEYTRCFYKLTGKDTIYQETPCDEPRVQWKTVDGKLRRHYNSKQLATWDWIDEHYTCAARDFQVRYERKAVEEKGKIEIE